MKLFSLIGHKPATQQDPSEDDAFLHDDSEINSHHIVHQRNQGLSRWLARRKIERIQEKRRLRKSLEDYKHFTLDMIKERN